MLEKKKTFRLKSLITWLATPRLLFWLLPALIVLLVAGTIAQAPLGLYEAQKMFFSSLVFWLGPVPLPGAASLLALITLSLLVKFLFKTKWEWKKAGSHIAHLGVLILLFGGLMTALTAEEGYLLIPEGQSARYVADYHQRALVIVQDGNIVAEIPHTQLHPDKTISFLGLPFKLYIDSTCANCAVYARENGSGMTLKAIEKEKENENNMSGISFTTSGTDKDGPHIAFEAMPVPVMLKANGQDYGIAYGKARRALPFTIKLVDFQKDTYPGTDKARAYHSDVLVQDGGAEWPVRIEMNKPLRYKGYTLFQSSFTEGPDGTATVLAVVKNQGWMFPYIGTAIMGFGLLLHLLLMIRRERTPKEKPAATLKPQTVLSIMLLMGLLTLMPAPSFAKDQVIDMQAFGELPILHEGRIKPLDSFARAELRLFSGQDSLHDMSALRWLAESIFNPQSASTRAVFKIGSPDLLNQMGLAEKKKELYSLADLARGLSATEEQVAALMQKEDKDLSAQEKELLALHGKALSYAQLLKALSMILPLQTGWPERLPKPSTLSFAEGPTYLELKALEEKLTEQVKKTLVEKGETIEDYTREEQESAGLLYQIQHLQRSSSFSTLFRILPPQWAQSGETWLSPWEVLLSGQGGPQSAAYLKTWQALARAWRTANADAWNEALQTAREQISPSIEANEQYGRLRIEILYNTFKPFLWASIFYALSVTLLNFFTISNRFVFYYLGVFTALPAITAHGLGILFRMLVLARPPVGSLYESLLFVSLVAIAVTLIYEFFRRDGLALLSGATAALGLLLIAPAIAPEGDSMQTLVAVLNTNFWLGTHVVCITVGYGVCILTAMLAHIYLLKRVAGTSRLDKDKLLSTVYRLSILALFFTAVGTVLGGIWADQSWGRFWGWDPKENGALLIILWLVWLQHGKIIGALKPLAYAAGAAMINVMVALAWFGVNLLSVGLHSYGFISGIATGLFLFCGAELLIVSALILLAKSKERAYAA